MVAQLVLAWLLMPADFGLIGLAYTVIGMISVLQAGGLREVLIYRGSRMRRWENAGFWLSVATGLGYLVVLAIAAPVAARLYADPRLTGLVLVLAAAGLLQSVALVPLAGLQATMRFREGAAITMVDSLGWPFLCILFALLRCGPYSFALPRVVIALVQLVLYWRAYRGRIRWDLQLRRWPPLLRDTVSLMGSQLAYGLLTQADRIGLGLFRGPDVVGLYFFAFTLSTQTVQLLSTNLTSVLLPAFAKLGGDAIRQRSAFLKATQYLAVLGMPLCVLQAALASPAIHLFFASRWAGAIGILQILSVAMAFNVVAGPSWSLIKAQGRFRAFLGYICAYAAVVSGAVVVAAWLGGVAWVAAGVCVCYAIFTGIAVYIAMVPLGTSWGLVAQVFWRPVGISIVVGVTTLLMHLMLRRSPPYIELLCSGIAGTLVWGVLVRALARHIWDDAVRRSKQLSERARGLVAKRGA